MSKPEIWKASFSFSQEGNTHGTTQDTEELTVEAEFPAGEAAGPFLVLRTDGWSIDEPIDLVSVLDRVRAMFCRPTGAPGGAKTPGLR